MTELCLVDTDLLDGENVEDWAKELVVNRTLTELGLDGVKDDMIQQLKEATKLQTPKLYISS